jgi:hypothetical protein
MIYGPKDDGTYIVEFRTAAGESLAISIPRSEAAVIKHFQDRMPHGLFVPDGATGAMRPFLFRVLVATFLFAAEHPQGPQIANAQEHPGNAAAQTEPHKFVWKPDDPVSLYTLVLSVFTGPTYDDGFGRSRYTKFCHRYGLKQFIGTTDFTIPAEDAFLHQFGNDAD